MAHQHRAQCRLAAHRSDNAGQPQPGHCRTAQHATQPLHKPGTAHAGGRIGAAVCQAPQQVVLACITLVVLHFQIVAVARRQATALQAGDEEDFVKLRPDQRFGVEQVAAKDEVVARHFLQLRVHRSGELSVLKRVFEQHLVAAGSVRRHRPEECRHRLVNGAASRSQPADCRRATRIDHCEISARCAFDGGSPELEQVPARADQHLHTRHVAAWSVRPRAGQDDAATARHRLVAIASRLGQQRTPGCGISPRRHGHQH